jgi:hypothetical protein
MNNSSDMIVVASGSMSVAISPASTMPDARTSTVPSLWGITFFAFALALGRSKRGPDMADIQLHTQEVDPESQIIEAARDLVRVRKRKLPLEQYLDALEGAVGLLAVDEFYCWSEEVNAIVLDYMDGVVIEERQMEWDYSAHFNQGLTRAEAADRLYLFLQEAE